MVDTMVLAAIFAGYLWRVSKLPREDDDDDNDDDVEVGPAAALEELPKKQQWAIMAALTVVAAAGIVIAAGPFAEAWIATGDRLGWAEVWGVGGRFTVASRWRVATSTEPASRSRSAKGRCKRKLSTSRKMVSRSVSWLG